MIRAADTILEFPMVDQDPLPWWTQGRVTLLGDAAHPMLPRGSNGAGQAILDARALADALRAAAAMPAAALQATKRERLEATTDVVLTNRSNPPDAILREVYVRTGDKPFERIEDVISRDELRAISDSYKRVAGLDRSRRAVTAQIDRCSTTRRIDHGDSRRRVVAVAAPAAVGRPSPARLGAGGLSGADRSRSSCPSRPAPASTSSRARSGRSSATSWKVAVVVDNRPGASGNIGTEAVAKRRPTATRCW